METLQKSTRGIVLILILITRKNTQTKHGEDMQGARYSKTTNATIFVSSAQQYARGWGFLNTIQD